MPIVSKTETIEHGLTAIGQIKLLLQRASQPERIVFYMGTGLWDRHEFDPHYINTEDPDDGTLSKAYYRVYGRPVVGRCCLDLAPREIKLRYTEKV